MFMTSERVGRHVGRQARSLSAMAAFQPRPDQLSTVSEWREL